MPIETGPDKLETIYRRRAVRAFKPKVLGKTAVMDLLAAAVQAPTAMHQEPWAFVVVQDRDRLHRYSELAKTMALTAERDAGALVHIDGQHRPGQLEKLSDPAFNIFYNAGTLILICCKTSGVFADADCWLAAENLMLAAAALGLGTCCIGFAIPALNMPDVKQELGIPAEGAAVVPIIIGFPSDTPITVPRKAPEVLSWL